MKPITTALLSVAFFLSGSLGAADAPNVDDLINQLQGKAPLAAKSPAELEAAYVAVFPKLTEKPEGDDLALQNIAFRATRPGAEAERAVLAKVLASKLTADAPVPLKVMLLRHIQRIGQGEVVPAVVALLGDANEQVRECARRALEANPSKESADALRAAIATATDGKWKAALVTALEYRRDPADAAIFAKLATSDDDGVRAPALLALGRTGDASAAMVLAGARTKGSEVAQRVASDAYLLLADRLAAANQKEAAASIYREFLTGPAPFRYAAIIGLGRQATAAELGTFIDLLGDKDNHARGAALAVLASHKDAAVSQAIAGKIKSADAAAKPWLIRALLDQGGKDNVAIFVTAASDPEEAVRIQAIKALGIVGDASALPLLLKSAQAKGDEQAAARTALENLPGKEIDQGLLPLVAKGSTPERVEAIRTLGARNVKDAVASILTAATDAEAAVRNEAFKSLGLVADYSAVPQVIGLIAALKEDGDRESAGKALAAVVRKGDDEANRLNPIIDAAEKAAPESKATLLSVLGQVGGAKALAAVRLSVASTDAVTHEAAVRALTNWSDDAPMADLLQLSKTESKENLAILSLRGYIRLVGINRDKRKVEENLKLYGDALSAAKRNDEKKQVLGGMGDIKDIKALKAIAPMLADAALVNEAAAAAIKVAEKHADKDKALTKSTMEKIIEVSKNEGHKKQAGEILKKIAPAAPEKK